MTGRFLLNARNFLLAILSVTLLLGIDAGIDAGFHGSGLICNRCHTIHYSENGNNGGSYPTTGFGPGGTYGADPGGSFAHLLISKNSSALCLLCHDGDADPNAPDVLGDDDFRGGQLSGSDTRLPENEHGICIRHPNTESERVAWEAINKHTGGTDPAFWFAGSGDPFNPDLTPGGRLPFIVSEADAADYSTAVTPAENNQVFCLSCHKPHGSLYNSAMRWDYPNDSNLGCQQCHNKGS
jgi:predicted CXXCH cytochrome family protein